MNIKEIDFKQRRDIMKKFFSVLIALTMILSSFVVFADETANTTDAVQTLEFSDVDKNTAVGIAVENLVANNILNGYPDGTFKPNGDITRAEFAAVIARFKGIATNLAEDAITGFSDLDSDDSYKWARPYVKAAVDSGVINGFEDGTFRAAEFVTYEQAVKMIVCAINYHAKANSELSKLKFNNSNVRWSAGYIAVANQIGLSKNAVVTDVTLGANRGLVAILTNNAFSAPKVNVTTDNKGNVSFSTGGGGYVSSDKSDLEEEIKGIVTATKYTSLDNQDSGLDEGEIKIDDEIYKVEQELYEELNLLNLIGHRVEVDYSKREGEITAIRIKTNTKYLNEIYEEDLIRPFAETEINYYYNDNGRVKKDTEKVEGFKFIYNGKYIPDATFATFNADGEYPLTSGKIEIIDDVLSKVVKITNYEILVVKDYNKTNKKITFRYNKKYKGKDSYEFDPQPSKQPQIYVDGIKKELGDLSLKAYNVINLMESPENSLGEPARIMRVTTNNTPKKGEVTEELVDGRKIQIDNETYYLTNDYANYKPINPGDEEKPPFRRWDKYDFYFDYMGQIAAIKYSMATVVTNYKYGYLTLVVNTDDGWQIGFIDEKGVLKQEIPLKSTIELDGERVNATDVASKLLESAKVANSAYNKRVQEDEKWNASEIGEDSYAQPIRYSLSSGVIDGIDTVCQGADGPSPEDLLECKISLETSKNGKTSVKKSEAGAYRIDDTTKILYVPDDRDNYNSYRLLTRTEAFTVEKQRYVEVFATTGTAAYIIIYQRNPLHEFRAESPYMMVSDIVEDGKIIWGYGKNTGNTVDKITIADEDAFETDVDPKCVSVSDLQKGDIIQYVVDTKTTEVVAMRLLYDADNPSQAVRVDEAGDAAKNQRYFGEQIANVWFRTVYGTLLYDYYEELKDNEVLFTWYIKADSDELNKEDPDEGTIRYNISGVNIIEFNGTDVKKLESIDDIATMDEDNPSEVMIISKGIANGSTAQCVFVFNTPEPENSEEENTEGDKPTEGEPTVNVPAQEETIE